MTDVIADLAPLAPHVLEAVHLEALDRELDAATLAPEAPVVVDWSDRPPLVSPMAGLTTNVWYE
ncbi:MAG: hypothetical protein GC157_09390 [Frankiales bacterium]|nr:hypothetical protein [Frankiales bacterium]